MKLEEFPLSGAVMPLQEWFSVHARVLPWRSDPTPYHVWISEIMLQQTRVEAVKAYYARFIAALPGVEELAACPEDVYMKLWEGLGYYSRVRNLHTAACQIMEKYGGKFPEEEGAIRSLKGIGSYTAGAICSIAFGKPVPAVDGNVLRVLMRLAGDDSDIMLQTTRRRTETVLRALMERYQTETEGIRLNPAVFSQALMELGALVCVPNGEPKCEKCPWQEFCQAKLLNKWQELPVKKKAKGRRIEERTVLVLKDGERAAIRKRPAKGLLAGLYELPNLEGHLNSKAVLAYARRLGFRPLRIQPLEAAKHIFSHVEWHMIGYELKLEEEELASEEQKQMRKKEGILFADAKRIRESYAIPTAFGAYAKYI